MLGDEFGTASNIKSRVNRQSVLGAITSAQQRLKLYNKVGQALYTLEHVSLRSLNTLSVCTTSASFSACMSSCQGGDIACKLKSFCDSGPSKWVGRVHWNNLDR